MADKIDGISRQANVAGAEGRGKAQAVGRGANNAGNAKSQETPGSDTVSLTDSARLLQKLEENVANTPVVDSLRVDALKKAVQDGSYQIDAGNIADKLLDIDRELE